MSDNFASLNEPEEPKNRTWDDGCLWPGIGAILGGVALGLIFVLVSLARISWVEVVKEPEITIIPPASSTPKVELSTLESGADVIDETATANIGVSEVFEEGDLVEVFGTEGSGLSLRNAPGISSVVGEYGLESEVFEVFSGPIDADGYTWWYLVNPYDNAKQGWGVGRYLRKISP